MAHKPTHPIVRAAFGVAALAVIVILANWLVSLTPAGNRGYDFTENKNHTVSDGTVAILSELDTAVVIRYYASRSSDYMPEQVKLHMRRVDDLLKEYGSLAADGKLRIENLDPEPDTDAEDRANLDGISGQRINDQNVYFGLAVSCLENTVVIPFLDPRDETMLEYHLSKAISDVTTPTKPVIGLMSGLDLKGAPAMMPGQRPSPPWAFYQQLKQTYKVVELGMTPITIDPKEIKVLLLFHPAGITPEAEFAVDQYLLAGGTVVACVDPFSLIADAMGGGGNPMMGGGGGPSPSSTLPTLFPAWGVSMDATQPLGDPTYKTRMRTRESENGTDAVAVLTLPQAAMPQKDNVITKGLESLMLVFPGGIKRIGGGGVDIDVLVKSSTQAGLVDPMLARTLDPTLAQTLKPEGIAYDLVCHLHGNFKTAFPDGKPAAQPDAAAPKPEDPAKSTSLKTSASPGNVFLITDVDLFHDQFAYNPQMLQFGMISPVNGNVPLFLNMMDQALGSKYLIGSRSRAGVHRPFTVINDLEDKFDKKAGQKRQEFRDEVEKAERELGELQAKRANSADPHLSPEQEETIKILNKKKVDAGRNIRELEKDLRREKDNLAGRITLYNVLPMPLLVILLGLGLYLYRRSSTRAR